jgi:hypothetical protein
MLMTTLAVEVTEDETRHFHDAGFASTKIAGRNFDGDLMNTILISLTSTATIKALVPLLVEIVRTRRSGAIRVNGMEIRNVSEKVILEALKTGAPEDQ